MWSLHFPGSKGDCGPKFHGQWKKTTFWGWSIEHYTTLHLFCRSAMLSQNQAAHESNSGCRFTDKKGATTPPATQHITAKPISGQTITTSLPLVQSSQNSKRKGPSGLWVTRSSRFIEHCKLSFWACETDSLWCCSLWHKLFHCFPCFK